jgi:hypothetical protein
MLYLNSSHGACRRERSLRSTGPQRWRRRGCSCPSYTSAAGLANTAARTRPWSAPANAGAGREQVALVVPVLAVVGFAAEALRPASHPPRHTILPMSGRWPYRLLAFAAISPQVDSGSCSLASTAWRMVRKFRYVLFPLR